MEAETGGMWTLEIPTATKAGRGRERIAFGASRKSGMMPKP